MEQWKSFILSTNIGTPNLNDLCLAHVVTSDGVKNGGFGLSSQSVFEFTPCLYFCTQFSIFVQNSFQNIAPAALGVEGE